MIQIAIVEDDIEIASSLAELIGKENDFVLIKIFPDAESFMDAFMDLNADVVIMDIGLPGQSGIQAVAKLKLRKPNVQFIMCTVFDDDENIFQSLCVGATGYLVKNTTADKLSDAIRTAYSGGSPMSATIARKVVESFQSRQVKSNEIENLTSRQWEILTHLDRGLSYKEIADKLSLTFDTIRTYIREIYDKLQVHSRTQAVNKIFPRN